MSDTHSDDRVILTNDFGWSSSRERTFQQCQRQYWFTYYGAWGGWEENAEPRTRELWILKQLQSRYMWLGDLVHRMAAFALGFARQNRRLPPEKELLTWVDARMREEFRASRDNELRTTGLKTTRLIEHDLGPEPSAEDWQTMHRRLVTATRTFARSELVAKIVATPLERWLPIEEHQSFELDDLTVRVKLDFAYVDGDELVIVDWKTNSRVTASSPLQLACYALFAYEAWRFPANRIRTLEVNLLLDRTIPRQISQDDIDRAMQDIRRSASAMKGKLDDPDQNEASEDAFDKVETTSVCRWCNYQSLCLGGRAQDVLRRPNRRSPGR